MDERIDGIEGMEFHDAILDKILISWGARKIAIEIMMPESLEPDAISIELLEFSYLVVPQLQAWGGSIYIDSLRATSQEIIITMQSGDVIFARCEGVSVIKLRETS